MKKNITEAVQASFKEKNQDPVQDPVKALPASSSQIRIPTQRPVPQLNHRIKRKTQQVSKEWTAEVSHTDQFTSHLPPSSEAAPDLAPRRIQRFHQKKNSALLKKMVELHDSAKRKVEHKVSVVAESTSQQKLEKEQDELWRDMMKPHEERHFQIGRVINYYS
jgi:hypothetical protein